MQPWFDKQQGSDPDTFLDLSGLLVALSFVVGALKRRWSLATVVGVSTLLLAGVFLAIMPRTYRIETRILTNPSYILPALASPRRAVPFRANNETRGVAELVKSRKNLSAIIEEVNLLEAWEETRTPVGQAMDALRHIVFGRLSKIQKTESLISILDKKLIAYVANDVVVITIEWHDPETALRLVETAQRRFLEDRRRTELGEVRETVHILESRIQDSLQQVDEAAANLREVVGRVSRRGVVRYRAPTRRSVEGDKEDAMEGGDLQRLERELKSKRESIARMESHFQENIRTTQARLDQLQSRLGPAHPDVKAAMRDLQVVSRPPEELTVLKTEEARLATRIRRNERGGRGSVAFAREIVSSVPNAPSVIEDPDVQQAMAEYDRVGNTYTDYLGRLDAANIETETAKAAFDYRYIVTQPPIMPSRAVKPKPVMILGGGLFVALLLAAFAAVAADLLTMRAIESWQITRFVGIPVLSEIDPP